MDMIPEFSANDMQMSICINAELTPEEYVLWRANTHGLFYATIYALTNTRLIVITHGKKTKSFFSIAKDSLKYESKKNGVGKITFRSEASTPKITLTNIPQVETVAFLLTSMLDKS